MKPKIACFVVASLALALISCQQEYVDKVDTLTRDTDRISLAYNNSSATFTVRSDSPWTVRTDADWLTLDPQEGPGSREEYITVTATAQANTGDSRSAIIYLESNDGTSLEIKAVQAAGIFEIGDPVLGGTFRIGTAPNATIDIPYTKAQGGEEVSVRATISGDAADGITFAEYKGTIPAAGNGSLSAPFAGAPTTMGDVVIDAEVIYQGKTVASAKLAGAVFDEKTILLLPASKFPWGGHYLENTGGIRSVVGEAVGAKVDDETVACGATNPGTTDLFRSGMEEFMLARGLKGYEGSKVYEHGGYLKIGTSAVGGYFMTPELSSLEGTTDISVEFDYVRWAGDEKEVTISAVNGGELTGGVLSTAGREGIHYNYVIYGAGPQTRVKWSATDLTAPGARFFISNIVIAIAEELKAALPAPTGIKGTAFEKSINIQWNPVTNATGYEVKLAAASAPGFYKTILTDKTEALFDNLTPDTEYSATVKALYDRNHEFDSVDSEPVSVKTLFVLPGLSAPTVKIYKSERAMVIIEFSGAEDELEGSRTFSLELRDASGKVLRSYPKGNFAQVAGLLFNRFIFADLETSTKYKIAVQRNSTDGTKFNDSEWTVLDYTSEPDIKASDYVFYEDFNNQWIGGSNIHLAWGPQTTFSTNYPIGGYVDKETSRKECVVVCRPECTCANAWTSTFTTPYSYLDDYWSKWNYGEKFTEDVVSSEKAVHSMLYPGSGCVKYGSGSSNGFIVLPALKNLTAKTDLVVTFSIVPYAVCNATDHELVATSECLTCSGCVYKETAGTIEGAGNNGIIVFDVKSAKQLGAWVPQTFSFTVKGADASTRIVIASGDAGAAKTAKNRMWLDQVTVVKK